ncbi:MAG TPA: PilZ domain-containing protein [Candidatus Aquicultor sp.]|jgi:c-di-GMP-binding flagellar brake protein YcgR
MLSQAFDFIKSGQLIYIEDARGSSWPYGISNVLSRELVLCQALGRKSTPLYADDENIITIIIPTDNGAHLVRSKIEESDDTNSRLLLRPLSLAKHVQRRRYFRLEKPVISAYYQLIARDQDELDALPVEAMVWDLSGSGMGMIVRSPKTPYLGGDLKLIIQLPEEQEATEIVGEIVRVMPRSIIKSEYLLGVNFTKIKERDRDKIVKYITQEQLTLLKPKPSTRTAQR